jgi:hypothetical protein
MKPKASASQARRNAVTEAARLAAAERAAQIELTYQMHKAQSRPAAS